MVDKQVTIIGCGPAGMLIAHACSQRGLPWKIIAPQAVPSVLGGAQYLHRWIPELECGPAFQLEYIRLGTKEGYERKIYGKLPEGVTTSWDTFPSIVRAWSLRETYWHAWARYYHGIEEATVTLDDLLKLAQNYVVFNTAPLNHLMPDHEYITESVYVSEGHSAAGINQIIYNGLYEDDWYRTSNINGASSFEIPGRFAGKPAPNWRRIIKPVSTTATIPGVHLLGRYGQWKKGVLVDDAYFEACRILDSTGI